MNFIGRFTLSTLIGFAIAGLFHIGIVLYMPQIAKNSAYHRISSMAEEGKTILIPQEGKDAWLPAPDPFMAMAACSFDVTTAPMRISIDRSSVFYSLSIHDRHNKVLIAATDRAALGDSLDIIAGTSAQIEKLKAASEKSQESLHELYVIMDEPKGYAVTRVLSPYPSFQTIAHETAQKLACVRY